MIQRRGNAGTADLPTVRWSPREVKVALQQAAEAGELEEELRLRLRAGKKEDAESGLSDLVLTAELCRDERVRDYVLMAQLAERLVPQVPAASTPLLVRIGSAYASLGVLHSPIFFALAKALLQAWARPQGAAGSGSGPVPVAELTEVARCFAAQRMRHEELFGRLSELLRAAGGATAATPAEALSLLHSYAFLRLGGSGAPPLFSAGSEEPLMGGLMESELGEDLWSALEAQVLQPSAKERGADAVSELCYILLLARRSSSRVEDIANMLEQVAPELLAMPPEQWFSEPRRAAMHRRVLLLRSAVRYLHPEAYKELPLKVREVFRRAHRMDRPLAEPRPTTSFTRKLSAALTKLRIGNSVNVEKGPFILDVMERDRKVVYECNHFDRFYVMSTEKIATMSLQERIIKAMGFRVVQVPHWQWSRIKHRRQRAEYIRMSRYYAIKDRREFVARDEPPEDVAVNEFDYLGEYFFRKDRPMSHWSWFQPRYEAALRLPQIPERATP